MLYEDYAKTYYSDIRRNVQKKVLAYPFDQEEILNRHEFAEKLANVARNAIDEMDVVLTTEEKSQVLEMIQYELVGLGPLEPILEDVLVNAIFVTGSQPIVVAREGKLQKTSLAFDDEDHLLRIIERIITPLGRIVNESHPIVDARLIDGSHVNVVIPPISMQGTILTIQKAQKEWLTWEDIIGYGSATPEVVEFLKACIEARLNVCVSGGISSGKTTILNALMRSVGDNERVISISDTSSLEPCSDHFIALETRPPNLEGKGEISTTDLMMNALRMMPERIIVSEVRGDEVWYYTQAINSGHDGALFTVHATNPRDALDRLQNMAMMAASSTPITIIRDHLATAIDIIVQINRLHDGTRKIVNVTEVTGVRNNIIETQDIFEFQETGFENNRIVGKLLPTGNKPRFLERGVNIPDSMFEV